MPSHLLASLLCLGMAVAGPALAQAQASSRNVSITGATAAPAGQGQGMAAADPELNWRDPQWLARQREPSRWNYQVGLEQQVRSPQQFGPKAAVREAVWAGVSYDLTTRLSGGVEAPVWQRDSGWASRMDFQRAKSDGLTGLRGALSYKLGSQSKLMLRPQARRVMLTYAATW